jgi:hypothetical protein
MAFGDIRVPLNADNSREESVQRHHVSPFDWRHSMSVEESG